MDSIHFQTSNFLNNRLAENSEVFHTWIVNEFSINLIKDQDKLKYETIDHVTEKLLRKEIIDLGNKTLEQMVSCLKLCKPIVDEEDKSTTFSLNYCTWKVDEGEVRLLRGHQDLLWNVFFKSTNKDYYFSFQETTIPSQLCHPETIVLIDKIKTQSFNRNYIDCLRKDFTVTRILKNETFQKECTEVNKATKNLRSEHQCTSLINIARGVFSLLTVYYSGNKISNISNRVSVPFGPIAFMFSKFILAYAVGKIAFNISKIPFSERINCLESISDKLDLLENRVKVLPPKRSFFVEIEPKSKLSQIDSRLYVSKFTWAVTLATGLHGKCGNHAFFLIEGLANKSFDHSLSDFDDKADGKHFIHKSEFNPTIRSRFYSIKNEKIKEDIKQGLRRTKIWMKSSEMVTKMLQDIEKEKKLQQEQFDKGIEPGFSRLGHDSIFNIDRHHNCFTWARDRLKMLDVELEEDPLEVIAIVPNSYTRPSKEYEKEPVIVQI